MMDVICDECGSKVHRADAEYVGDAETSEWVCSFCQDATELQWFKKREGLVQQLVVAATCAFNLEYDGLSRAAALTAVPGCAKAVRDFREEP